MTTRQRRGRLAVVDMQRVFEEPESPWATPRFAEAAEAIARLLPVFGDRVSFTRFVAPDEPIGVWKRYYDQWPFALQPPGARLWELTDRFAAHARHVVDATTFSKWTPELARWSGTEDVLVVAGVTTDCCVLTTALAAADAGVEVQVVTDACAGVDDQAHEAALRVLGLYAPHIRLTTVADVIAEAAP